MTVSRFTKAVAYAVICAILIAVSAVLSVRLHNPALMETTYFHTNLYWGITAIAFLGGGVFCWREYAKNDPEHRPDVLFTVIFGAVLLIGWFVMFMQYGALVVGHFSENAYTAVNLNMLVLWGLPIPLLVRLSVLAVSSRIENIRHRRAVQALAAVLIAAFITVTIACNMVQMVRYEEPETNTTQTEE